MYIWNENIIEIEGIKYQLFKDHKYHKKNDIEDYENNFKKKEKTTEDVKNIKK